MPKGTNQKLKFAYLMQIMLEKTDDEHGITMPQILAELEKYEITAERKSIYSDLDDMDKFGIEIWKEQIGRETYYHVGSREFELAEVKLLIDAIQSSKFITEKKSTELINKIKKFVSKYESAKLQRQVYVHGRIKTSNESIYYAVDAIHAALAENKKIRFLYCSWNTRKQLEPRKEGQYYVVSPWKLTWNDENYYLIGYDSEAGKLKHYRVDKMLSLSVVDEPREGKTECENMDMAVYAKQSFGMYGGEKKKVHIEFPDGMVGVFIDRLGSDITIRPAGEGRSRIAVDIYVSNQFYGWIFGLGTDVKVTGPDEVVTRMAEYVKALSENYSAKERS